MSCPVQEVWRYSYPLKVESLVTPQFCSLHISIYGVLCIADMQGKQLICMPLLTLNLPTAASPVCVKDMQSWFLPNSLPADVIRAFQWRLCTICQVQNTVPSWSVPVISTCGPAAVLVAYYFVACPTRLEFHNTLLGCLMCVIATALATNLVKLSVRTSA